MWVHRKGTGMKDGVVKKRVKMNGEKWYTDMGSLESLLTKRPKLAFQLLRNGSLVKYKEEKKGQEGREDRDERTRLNLDT